MASPSQDVTLDGRAAVRSPGRRGDPGLGRAGRPPAGGPQHVVLLAGGRLRPDRGLGRCLDCQVSCQSACKTSCTVGNQRCPK